MIIEEIRDIELLIRIRFDFFAAIGHPVGDDKEEMTASLRNYFNRHIDHDFIALALKEKDTIISSGYLIINEIPANRNALSGLTGTLLNLFTYPEYQGCGHAANLIEAFKKEALNRNLSFIDLYATEQGIPLYRKTGFEPISYQAMRLKL